MTHTDAELIAIGQKQVDRQEKQKEYDRIYNGRKKFEAEQFKQYAIDNDFEMPEYPEELQMPSKNEVIDEEPPIAEEDEE